MITPRAAWHSTLRGLTHVDLYRIRWPWRTPAAPTATHAGQEGACQEGARKVGPWLPGALFGVVLLTNLGPDFAQALTGILASRWFYVFRGLEGTLAFWLLMAIAPRRMRYVWLWTCLWAVYESAATVVCGTFDLFERMPPPIYSGLCDVHTGLPLYWVSVIVAGALAWALIRRKA